MNAQLAFNSASVPKSQSHSEAQKDNIIKNIKIYKYIIHHIYRNIM